MAVLTRPVYGLCHVEALCQIWWESDERFGSYSCFSNCNMAAGGHLGLWVSTFRDHRLVPGVKWMINTKFGAYRMNPFEVIQFSVNFSFSSAAILDFAKKKNGGFDTSGVWAVSCRSSVPNLVRIGRTVRKFLQILTWRPAAILDYAFRHFGNTILFRVRSGW